jgi:hypothetical protein
MIGEYDLDRPVIKVVWAGPGTALGIDGLDRVIRFRAAGAGDPPRDGPG